MLFKKPSPPVANAYLSPPYSDGQKATLTKWLGTLVMIDQHWIGYPLQALAVLLVLFVAYWLILG